MVDYLKTIAENVNDKEKISQVGTISANNDNEIGNLIAEAMEKVGQEGVITVEEARGLETKSRCGRRQCNLIEDIYHLISFPIKSR